MDIRVRIDSLEPVEGAVVLDDVQPPCRFVGWLGLLQALSDLVATEVGVSSELRS